MPPVFTSQPFFDWCKTQNEKTFADKQVKKKEKYYGGGCRGGIVGCGFVFYFY
jgi:hypothetical protein